MYKVLMLQSASVVGWYKYTKAQWISFGIACSQQEKKRKDRRGPSYTAVYSFEELAHCNNRGQLILKKIVRESQRGLPDSEHSCPPERPARDPRTKLHGIFYEWWCHFPRELIGGWVVLLNTLICRLGRNLQRSRLGVQHKTAWRHKPVRCVPPS